MTRPFDDDDDAEDDEEHLIVYKEKPAPNFALSQLTQKNSQHQSQGQESLSPPKRPRMISRQERRKRRNEWRERQRLDQEIFINSPEDTVPSSDSEDAFESLKSFFPDSQNITPTPKPVKRQQPESEKENVISNNNKTIQKVPGSPKMERENIDDKSTGNWSHDASMTNDDPNETTVRKSSMDKSMGKESDEIRDFVPMQDYGEDMIDDRVKEKSHLRSSEYQSRVLERSGFESDREPLSPVRPRKKSRKSHESHDKQRDNTPKTSKNSKSGSKLRESSTSKRKSLSRPWSTSSISQSQGLTPTQRVNSIVGLRPSTWKKEQEKPLEWKQPRASQKHLSKSISSKSRQLSVQKPPSMSQIRAKYIPQPHRPKTSSSWPSKRNTAPQSTDPSGPMSSKSKPQINFTPSFLPTNKNRLDNDDVEEVPEKALRRVVPATSPVQPTSSLFQQDVQASSPIPLKSARRGKKTIGPLQRRLEALQNARSNDAIRLQNEAFRRHASFEIKNDYRRKSRSHTDITVLGDCSISLRQKNNDGSSKLSVLVYIHSHTQHDPEQHVFSEQQPTLRHQLAWATFTYLTARSINLQKGKQLRLYNSIILPCLQPTTVEGLNIDSLESNVCDRVLVSTWLCENHPGGLPKLPFAPSAEHSTAIAAEVQLP